MAFQMGYAPNTIVFDSPVKTSHELGIALKKGVLINANSFQELDRIATHPELKQSISKIGIRVNPQIGKGKILSTSVGDTKSKFGVPLQESKQQLITYYKKYDWLIGIHFHVGSQGISVAQLVATAKIMYAQIQDIEVQTKKSYLISIWEEVFLFLIIRIKNLQILKNM